MDIQSNTQVNSTVGSTVVNNNVHNKKNKFIKIILIILAVILLIITGYYIYLSMQKSEGVHVYTTEEKLKLMEDLNVPPPDDGTTQMTGEEKLSALKNLDKGSVGNALTEEERMVIIKSLEQ